MEIAIHTIQSGGLVAFPTETVYGLGADATNQQACQRIFAVKGRPQANPLIVHIASFDQALDIGEFSDNARKLIEKFWPGPLSIVVPIKKTSQIASSVTAGLNTVALRMPAHPVTQELIKRSNRPIAAPSANLSGRISATTYEHVLADFKLQDIFILESDNKCQYGIESTIVDMSNDQPILLRHGFITIDSIESVLNKSLNLYSDLRYSNRVLMAPGMMDRHYSPITPLRLNANNLYPGEIALNFGNSNLIGCYSLNLSSTSDLIEAASNLYIMLRELDHYAILNSADIIAVAHIPNTSIGIAINDRLSRAAKQG